MATSTPTAGRPDRVGETGANIRRALQEFLGVPILLVLGAVVLWLVTYLLDAAEPGVVQSIREYMKLHIFSDAGSSASLLAAIATSVVTVTSITFSLLLIAVQMAASTLSTQVFDQFMQRRANQVFFGYFLGVGLFALLTLATVTPEFNPVLGGTLALALTAVALILIPVVIYSTLDQMRPAEIVASIRTHGLAARERQLQFLARTRRSPLVSGEGRPIISSRTGFLAEPDLDALDAELERLGPDAELEIAASIGSFIGFGDELAILRATNGTEPETSKAIEGAIPLGRERELQTDPAQALAQLEAIGWTTISSSKQNPNGGQLVVFQLHDLIGRWARVANDATTQTDDGAGKCRVSAVVYHDGLLDQAVRTLGSMAVVASEGMQHQVAAAVYTAFARTFQFLPAPERTTAATCIARSLSGLADHVPTLELEEALRDVTTSLIEAGDTLTAAAVERAIDTLVDSSSVLSSRGNRPA